MLASGKKWPSFATGFLLLISSILCALFVAQLIQDSLGASFYLYILVAAACGALVSWVLINTRWSDLLWPLAFISLLFPAWFLLVSPVFKQLDEFATVSLGDWSPEVWRVKNGQCHGQSL